MSMSTTGNIAVVPAECVSIWDGSETIYRGRWSKEAAHDWEAVEGPLGLCHTHPLYLLQLPHYEVLQQEITRYGTQHYYVQMGTP